MLSIFSFLPSHCHFGSAGATGGGGQGGETVCQTATPLYAHTAPFGRAVLLGVWGVHSLPHGKERTKKTCKGLCPLTPRRPRRRNCSRLRWETPFPKAALKGLVWRYAAHLGRISARPRWSWASEAMPK